MTEPEQTRFCNGRLVTDDPHSRSVEEPDQLVPDVETGYRIEIKHGVLEANQSLRTVVDEHGRVLEFASRSQAEQYVQRVTDTCADLKIQAAPPNEPSDVDAYVLADHDPTITEPASTNGETWTFDVGANLYGTLGEAIITGTPKPHALIHYLRQDLTIEETTLEHTLTVDVDTDCVVSLSSDQGDRNRWQPDCKLIARDGWNGSVLEQYFCEIKTGNASFERSQIATMQQLAETERVLKIRVLIDELPAQYSVRIHEVAASSDT